MEAIDEQKDPELEPQWVPGLTAALTAAVDRGLGQTGRSSSIRGPPDDRLLEADLISSWAELSRDSVGARG